jgi:hypothetical protein
MNYYDALLQHRHRIEDVERHQENERHLRDSQRKKDAPETESPKPSSAFLRVMEDVKAAVVTTLSQVNQKRVVHAGHPAAIKDISC